MTTPAAEMQGVEFRYPGAGGFVLRVEALRLARGERAACVGASGCGKTTLINLLAGVLAPARGRVLLGGMEIGGLDEGRRRAERIRRVGLVFQEFELLDYLSAIENILLPYRLSSSMPLDRAARARAEELAGGLGIGALLGRRPAALSQGERQRVAVCRALVTGPELVIADEPTGNLDPANAESVIDLLMESVGRTDAAMLVVTHNHGLLDRFDRVIRVDELNAGGA